MQTLISLKKKQASLLLLITSGKFRKNMQPFIFYGYDIKLITCSKRPFIISF